jgi:hypothetical protein
MHWEWRLPRVVGIAIDPCVRFGGTLRISASIEAPRFERTNRPDRRIFLHACVPVREVARATR